MPDCMCEPCGKHCGCKCHTRKKEQQRPADLIAADPEIPNELTLQ